MYLFQISTSYSPKNKLGEAVLALVKSHERIFFEHRADVFAFGIVLKSDIDKLNKKFPRCKPIDFSVREAKIFGSRQKFEDIHFSISELFYGSFLEGKEVSDGK